jgi:hypothetical protein
MPQSINYGASPSEWAHLDLVLGLGEDLLPVVSNPQATISPDSAIKDVGKLPSTYNSRREVSGFAKWTQHSSTPNEISKWSKESDYGICLQTRRIRAIDVDINDEATARAVGEFVAFWLGFDLPRRARDNSTKFLLAFELDGEFTKRKFKTEHGIVEFLANGQQFIAVGTHPSGARYEWAGGLPDAFPVLDAAQFLELWEELAKRFAIEDATTQSASVKHEKLANVMSQDPIAQFLMNTNRVKRVERDGRLHIVCPWELDHTSETGDSSTTYWPAHTGGYANGHFHCLHAHCEARSDEEFLDAIEYSPTDEFETIGDGSHDGLIHADDPTPIDDANHDGAVDATIKPQRFKAIPLGEFSRGKPPQWIIKGVLPRAELAVLFGESGSGKSFAALDMAVDIAMGTTWRGITTKPGRVVYIAAEGAGGFRKRAQAIALQRGLEVDQIPMRVIADSPNLMEKTDALDVAKAIHSSGGADLVIIDTFAQTMPGANENAGEDVGKALAHCKGIHRATGALVMLVHHSGKDSSKGARGWSGLRAAADVELEVIRNDEARSLSVTKQKDGEDGAEFAFKLQSVVLGFDEDGEEITSCYVEHGTGTVARSRDRGPKGSTEKLVLTAMSDLVKVDSPFVDLHDVKEAAMAQMPHDVASGKRDTRSQRILRAIETLQQAKRIVINGTQLKFAEVNS